MLWKGVLLVSVRKGSRDAPCLRFWEMEPARTFITQTVIFHGVTTVLRLVQEANTAAFLQDN